MRILSLFDEMSCWYEALKKAWIPIDAYYASEIDKYAIQTALKNHPDIIEIWDVTKVRYSTPDFDNWWEYLCNESWIVWEWPIDLLIWGSPCQWFSMAGKMLNFEDPRSKLFFEYVRLLKEIKPKYFLLENVKMKKEFQDVISSQLGVEPIEIDSALVSWQRRKRLYRTNIPWVYKPQDKGILLKDVLETNAPSKYDLTEKGMKMLTRNFGSKWQALNFEPSVLFKITYPSVCEQQDWLDRKCPTLTASMWTWWWNVPCLIEPMAAYNPRTREFEKQWWNKDKVPPLLARDYKDPKVVMIPKEWENLVSVVDGEVRIKQATKQWYIVAHEWDGISLSYPKSTTRRGRVIEQKSNTLTASWWDSYVYDKVRIRKLTPIECERLQTLPDNYTEWVSDSQRYKMLGNWWTVDVIAHIFSFIPKQNG